METLQQQAQTYETKKGVLGRVTKFFMWHTIGKHQVDQAIYKLNRDKANPLDASTSVAMEQNRQAALSLFARYKEQLQLDIEEPINPVLPNNSSTPEQ